MATVVKFKAQVSQIRTIIDGGANVTLSLSGKEIKALTQLLEIRNQVGVILEVVAVPVIITLETNGKEKQKKRKQRYPYKP